MIPNTVIYGKVTLLDIIVAVIILLVALFIAKTISIYLRRFLKEKVAKEHLEVIIKVVSYTIIVIAVLSILPTIGVKLSGLLVAGGIVGLAIGFASQSIIGNLISGIFLMYAAMTKDAVQRSPSALLMAVSVSNGSWTFYEAIKYRFMERR